MSLTIVVPDRVKLLDAVDVRGLLGLLMPCGNLVPYRTPTGGFIQLTVTGGRSDEAYLEEKIDEFNRFIPTRAKVVPYRTKPNSKGRSSEVLRFRVSSNRLRPIYNMLYPGGYRQITQTMLDLLGARAAAWLWADTARIDPDGSAQLVRVGQTVEEAQLIARWLFVLTGANCFLDDDHVRPRLALPHREVSKVRNSLLPYAPETRSYLFKENPVDHVFVRSSRTELRSRIRQALLEEENGATLAGNPEAGTRRGLLELPAQEPAKALSV